MPCLAPSSRLSRRCCNSEPPRPVVRSACTGTWTRGGGRQKKFHVVPQPLPILRNYIYLGVVFHDRQHGVIMLTMCYPAVSSVLLLAYHGLNQTPSICHLVFAIISLTYPFDRGVGGCCCSPFWRTTTPPLVVPPFLTEQQPPPSFFPASYNNNTPPLVVPHPLVVPPPPLFLEHLRTTSPPPPLFFFPSH